MLNYQRATYVSLNGVMDDDDDDDDDDNDDGIDVELLKLVSETENILYLKSARLYGTADILLDNLSRSHDTPIKINADYLILFNSRGKPAI